MNFKKYTIVIVMLSVVNGAQADFLGIGEAFEKAGGALVGGVKKAGEAAIGEVKKVVGEFVDTYDECNQAHDQCIGLDDDGRFNSESPTYRSAASACENAGGVWTSEQCPGWNGACKNKCSHSVADYITTAKGCGICRFDYPSVASAYSKADEFKAGDKIPFAATFVHKKLCSVVTGDAALQYDFEQDNTDNEPCKRLYWNNATECPGNKPPIVSK